MMFPKPSLATLPLLALALTHTAAQANTSASTPVPTLSDGAFANAVRSKFGTPIAAMSNISTNANCDPSQTDPKLSPAQAYDNILLLFNDVCTTIPDGTNANSFYFTGSPGGRGMTSEDVTFITSVTLYESQECQGAKHTLPTNASGTCVRASDLGANTIYSAEFSGTWVPTSSLPPARK